MVGAKSTPVLGRNFNQQQQQHYSTQHTHPSPHRHSPHHRERSASTASSAASTVYVPDPMKLHALLRDNDGSTEDKHSPPHTVVHTKEELEYYLERIQSGIKPDPVVLPVAQWANGIAPPSTVASSMGYGSMASTPYSQMNTAAKKWLYSMENPAVVPIRKSQYGTPATNDTNDYMYDGATDGQPECGDQQQRQVYSYTTHPIDAVTFNVQSQILMPPEQSPFAERINKNRLQQERLVNKLRQQGDRIAQHFSEKVANGRKPTHKGSISKQILKEELSLLLCSSRHAGGSNGGTRQYHPSNQQLDPISVKDIDQLLCALPKEKLDVNGHVVLHKLLHQNQSKGNGRRYGGDIAQNTIIPINERATQEASLKRKNRNTFRVIVPDHKSDQYGNPEETYLKKNSILRVGLDEPTRIKRENHLYSVGLRNKERDIQFSARCEMEVHEREKKLQHMLDTKKFVKGRYETFLEKEGLRRMKGTGNRFALSQYHQTNPKRRGNSHQYIQEIGGLYRDKVVKEYNEKRSNLDQRLWNKTFRRKNYL